MRNSTLSTLLIIVFSISYSNLHATVHRVNNTGADADFASLQIAHNSALAGDTLYIESSPVSYGNLTISKEIHIFGTGFFLDQNTDLQASLPPSQLGTLSLAAGCSNSTLQGLTIDYLYSATVGDLENVLIQRNHVKIGVYFTTNNKIENFFIIGNYLQGNNSTYHTLRTGGSGSKTFTVLNNIFSSSGLYSRITLDGATTASFKNNIFDLYSITTSNCTYKNNIQAAGTHVNATNSYSNNLCNATQFPTGNGNMQNITMSTVFNGYPTIGSYSVDNRFSLLPGSPAIGAGEGGVDCGIFDGDISYTLSGIPAIPSIYKLIAPSVVTGNFNITISTRSNN